MANACSTNFERVKGDVDRTTRRRILDAYLSVSLTLDEVTVVSGRGVGLSAALAEVTALGGRLRVESTVGAGTRWLVTIPSPGGARLAAAS